MQKVISILTLLFITGILAQAQVQTSTPERVLSYQELLDEMLNSKDSVYRLDNAFIKYDAEKDQRFDAPRGTPEFENIDTVFVNVKVELTNISFIDDKTKKSSAPRSFWWPDFIKIVFKKSFSITNIPNKSALYFVHCRFESRIEIDLPPSSVHKNIYFRNCIFNEFGLFHISDDRMRFENCLFEPSNAKERGDYEFDGYNDKAYFSLWDNHFKSTEIFHYAEFEGRFRYIILRRTTFDIDVRILDSNVLGFGFYYNKFNGLIDLTNTHYGNIESELYLDQVEDVLAVYPTGNQDNGLYRPENYEDFADSISAERFFAVLTRVTDYFKFRGNRRAYNKMFVQKKDFETMNLQYYYETDPNVANWFSLNMNRFLKQFSAYGTDPVIAILYSIRVILFFGIFYLFFHNDWDYSNNKKMGKRLHFMLRYFKIKRGLTELDEEQRIDKSNTYESVLKESKTNKNQVPPFFNFFTKWYLKSNLLSASIRKRALKRMDVLAGTWKDLDRAKRISISILSSSWFILYLFFALLIKSLNALTLSLNAFTTLGFGTIPTKGMSRYVVIVQGFFGWLLMTVFSVTLITQLLQ
jgi:hypothetical protein